MITRGFLLFVLFPLADLLLLLVVARYVPLWVTLLIWAVPAAFGLWLIRYRWRQTLLRAQREPMADGLTANLAWEGMISFVAGLLLIAPGIVSDLIGVSLLIPVCRRWYRRRFLGWLRGNFQITHLQVAAWESDANEDDVMEGEFRPAAPAGGRVDGEIRKLEGPRGN